MNGGQRNFADSFSEAGIAMPQEIRWFEMLWFAALALGVIVTALDWQTMLANPLVAKTASAGLLFIVIIIALLLALVLLVSRKRKNWAAWILLVFMLLGIVGYIPQLSEYFSRSTLLG